MIEKEVKIQEKRRNSRWEVSLKKTPWETEYEWEEKEEKGEEEEVVAERRARSGVAVGRSVVVRRKL